MSWIQNLFQKLKREEDDEFSEYLLHSERRVHDPLTIQSESVKDVDVKIAYQYPRTSSGPSLIEHNRKKPEDRVPRKKRENETHHHVTSADKTTEKKELPKPKIETSRYRGPFHPTEIPSPVFGFQRPKKTNEVIEHELSHFFKGQEETPIQMAQEESKIDRPEIIQIETNQAEQIVPVSEPQVEVPVKEAVQQPEEGTIEIRSAPIVLDENEVVTEIIKNEPVPEEKEQQPVEQQTPPRRQRAHLPFNVMMLKQDREKWEFRKRERTERRSVEQLSKPPVEQPIEPPVKQPVEQPVKQPAEPQVEQMSKQPIEQQTAVNQQPAVLHQTINIQELNNASPIVSDGHYKFPEPSLLNPPVSELQDTEWLLYQEELLNQTLINFNVGASVVNVTQGPSVTRFEVQPEPGVKVNKVTNLTDDIKLSLAAKDIRIEAPIPGKHTIGIEVPNKKSRPVQISEIINAQVFRESSSPLTAVLGLDIAGNPIVTDLKKMPHGLIAGATGSGKSVCINSILVSLLYKASPDDLKLLLIDPKMVELAPYNRIPHLVSPVITDVKAATAALKWAVEEMERRYELFAHTGVRDINRFNELAMEHKRYSDKLPFIVIIIDELADLMMMSPADVEEAICRIAQKARACGIHLIVATQRPSVDVITGLIKANIPTRVAFSVSSQVDSRTVIDISGAERLLGRGDMLFLENGASKPVRLQGTFVSDEEIDVVVAHVKAEREPDYLFEQEELLKKEVVAETEDELFYDACEFILSQGLASTSSLQRRFKIGYNRAARLMDLLEQNGYITGANGSKPREVLMTEADLEAIQVPIHN